MSERFEHFLDHQVATRPDAPALADSDGTTWSFSELSTAADDIAALLRGAGVEPGDRVLILIENCSAAIAALFGAARAGAWAVPVNARQSGPEVTRILEHARPRVVLCTSAVSADAAAHAERLGAVAVKGRFGRLDMAVPYGSSPEDDLDVGVMLYTTGTTGMPKGVMLTHANLRFGGKGSAWLRDMVPEDVVYGVLPMTHIFGLASMIMASTYKGAMIRLETRFSAEKLYLALLDNVTLLPAVPQMHAMLMQYARDQGMTKLENAPLRYVSSGGAPLDPAWKRKAEGFYGVALQNGYGLTETTAGVCATKNQLGDPDISTGPALPDVEVKINDPVDGVGEVLIRGGHVMKGYYLNPEETAKVLDPQGWFHSGDLGKIDERGHLHIMGRSKELIIHGGFNVYPPEVEAALNDHPGVVQSAVVGRMREGDEEVLAFVQVPVGSDLDEATLKDFVRETLAGYKRPARIILSTELPAAPTGKPLKHKMLTHFADQLD